MRVNARLSRMGHNQPGASADGKAAIAADE
jgi:hypothetical protein